MQLDFIFKELQKYNKSSESEIKPRNMFTEAMDDPVTEAPLPMSKEENPAPDTSFFQATHKISALESMHLDSMAIVTSPLLM